VTGIDAEQPFAPPRAWRSAEGDFARPVSLRRSAEDLARRGFDVLHQDAHEVRAFRTRWHPELLTSIDVFVWLRRVDGLTATTIEADRERFADWIAARDRPRYRSRMTVLAYHADAATPEARAMAQRGPRMGIGRFHGLGIADRDGDHAYRGVRLVGLGFYPLLNFLVRTTLRPRPEREPRVLWVWGLIVTTGLLPVAGVLGWIAWVLLRARGLV